MHYPWWYVPHLTAPMLIAAIAVFHVIISHYAVGGGILLAMENAHGFKEPNPAYRAYWRRHARFFVLLTLVLGAVTGVGIWWTIGLASPLATEMLIRTFVFGWAIEWVFFVIELISAFILFYYWDRMAKKPLVIVGWIYAVAAWISLVLITGITAFMLNSLGLFGNWSETGNFWDAFFNLQFIPQTISRTGGALLLATLYVYLHASWTLKDAEMREKVIQRMSGLTVLGTVLMVLGVGLWYAFLPETAKLMLMRAAALNIFIGLFIASSAALLLMLFFVSFRSPRTMTFAFAICLFLFGIAALSTAEFIREAVRKPYIVDNVVLGNQVMVEDIPEMQEDGYLESGIWTKQYLRENYPELFADEASTRVDESRLLNLPAEDRVAIGRVLFMYHCNDCHAQDVGYSAVAPLVAGHSRERLPEFLMNLHRPAFYMPPWCGTPEEAEVLADYLATIAPEVPPAPFESP